MAKKIKLTDAAKDLRVSAQELAAFFEEHGDGKKKSGSSLTEQEMNLALEYYTRKNSVESFDAYFASKNQPKPAAPAEKEQKKPVKKAKTEKAEKPAEKAAEKSAAQETKPAPAKTEKPVEKAPEKPAEKPAEKAAEKPVEKAAEKPAEQPRPRKEEKKRKTAQPHGERTRLSGVMGSERTENTEKRRTVDTRGSYVDLDKYNERYEQIAPADRHKDNYSTKKQKINQKSAQKGKQRSGKKETEAQRMKRLELERARKQQLKVRIPDSITVSELAARLKVNVSKVIGKLMGLGVMASINEEVDFDTASLVAEELGEHFGHLSIILLLVRSE